MILLTVGTQLPFDRLVKAVDDWAGQTNEDVFAQIGNSNFCPKNIKYSKNLTKNEIDALTAECSIIIAHAGMGSIISALTNAKPVIIVPRLHSLGEHRNDHQVATAKKFISRDGVIVLDNLNELDVAINRAKLLNNISSANKFAPEKIIFGLKNIINRR